MYYDEIIKRIDSDRYYSVREIHEGQFFPWIKSKIGVNRLVAKDRERRNRLQANIIRPAGTRYHLFQIQGKHIIKYLKESIEV